tara:strand:+ start:87 stop:1142 length:1056 start_codon:yes stop_codon:yes gene_type:complete
MNWYSLLKLAQIWNIETDYSFKDELHRAYQLEYKRAMLLNRPFNGMEQRKENIIKQVEENLFEALNNLKEPLINVFQRWLQSHALTNPQQWAEQRSLAPSEYSDWEEYYESAGERAYDTMNSLVDTYMRLKNNNNLWYSAYQSPNWDSAFQKMMNENNGFDLPAFQNLTNLLLDDYKMMRREEIQQDLEEYNAQYGTQFINEDEAMNFVQNATAEQLGQQAMDILAYYDLETLMQIAHEQGMLETLIFEINKNIVFPVWYEYWSSKGIKETRATVEKVFSMLNSSEGLDDTIVAVNLSLNTAHQNGSMLEYLEEYGEQEDAYEAQQLLDQMSKGAFLEEWNEELREIGVQI